ncbi:MAG: hypothetical protein HWN80_00060 [Candidatus Lokiarchaeota archaeon]|nr:hypothetical protein [Candidatus Lokiarchaeota archaeon]
MSSLKEKIDIEELLAILFGMFLAGAILMWFFYTGFPEHAAVLTYLIIAVIFTILTVVAFVLLFLRKRKE